MAENEFLEADGGDIPFRQAIGLANDHAGFGLKATVMEELSRYCGKIIDVGAPSTDPVDFPDVTARAINLIQTGKVERVILLCGTGAGACIAANKFKGIRAAVAHDTYVARQAVVHDDVNVLCIGAWITGPQIALDIIRNFLAARFSENESFRRRVAKLAQIEEQAAGQVHGD